MSVFSSARGGLRTDLAPIKWTLNEGRSRLILGGVYDVAVSF